MFTSTGEKNIEKTAIAKMQKTVKAHQTNVC